jgi:hypothetical protein
MKLSSIALSALLAANFNAAQAAEYVCKVYCSNGSTSVVVNASSSSDAARKVDPTPVADQVCREAGKGKASSSSMSSGQCSAK